LRLNPLKRGAASDGANAIPPLIKRNTALFASAQALQGSGTQMVTALGAVTVLEITDSALLAGVGVSMLQLARIAISYPLGKLADTYGRKPAMLAGLFLGLAGAPILALTPIFESIWMFVLGAFVIGLGVGATQQLRVAVTDMFPANRRGEALGYLLTGSLLGTFVAPALIGTSSWLAPSLGINELSMPWLLTPLLIVPTVFAVLAVRPDPRDIALNLSTYWPNVTETVRAAKGRMSFREFVQSRPRLTAAVCYMPAQGVMSMMMATTPLVLTRSGHSLPLISLAVSIHVFGMFAFSIPLGRLVDRAGRTKVIWGGLATSAAGALLVPVTELYGIISLGIFLVGVGWSATFVAATAIIADTTPVQQRGRAIGLNDMMAAMFTIGLPLTGGWVADQLGLMALGVFGGLIVLLPLPLLLRLRELSPGKFVEDAEPDAAG
jgi:MFS family permease